MKIVGIVGWKDSGKTTIATKIINRLSSKNFRVASIKHAHHEFDIDHENTDSFKHRLAGSSQVIVSSSKRWVKISELNNSKEKTLDELINQLSEIDIVIVEGFKNENHPKSYKGLYKPFVQTATCWPQTNSEEQHAPPNRPIPC